MTIDRWFPFVKLPVDRDQFRQLPQHPAYKYEYIDGEAWLSARPKCYHALLTLQHRDPPVAVRGFGRETITFRSLRETDWPELTGLFAWAFHRVPPFSLLSDDDRRTAAGQCLEKTRAGGDGPVIDDACFVARCDTDDGEQLLGAILVTLMPDANLEGLDDLTWTSESSEKAPSPQAVRPHLTWVFTNYWTARHGVGAALLDRAVNALLKKGHCELASTFLLGNESSTLWHWRNGFRLLSYPGSPRAIERTLSAKSADGRVESR